MVQTVVMASRCWLSPCIRVSASGEQAAVCFSNCQRVAWCRRLPWQTGLVQLMLGRYV